MRLIIPVVIILLGGLAGALVCQLFRQSQQCRWWSVAGGAAGAFTGLVYRDLMDITAGGPAGGAFIAAIAGAVAVSLVINLYFKLTSKTL